MRVGDFFPSWLLLISLASAAGCSPTPEEIVEEPSEESNLASDAFDQTDGQLFNVAGDGSPQVADNGNMPAWPPAPTINGDMPPSCPIYRSTPAGKLCTPSPASASGAPVLCGQNGRLAYTATARGNRLMDFSYAGYCGGGAAWPRPAPSQTLSPSGGDDTAAVQGAIDAVAALPLDGKGMRGAVVLTAGIFKIRPPLNLRTSGLVVRGAGSTAAGTTLEVSGNPPASLFTIAGWGTYVRGQSLTITDSLRESGARTFHVPANSGLRSMMPVLIEKPITASFIKFMGMDTLVRNGAKQTWIAAGTRAVVDRVITQVSGTGITLDAPLADKIDATYITPDKVTLTPYTFPGRIYNVGVEHLRAVTPFIAGKISAPHFRFALVSAATDVWINDVEGTNFSDFITLSADTKRITLQDATSLLNGTMDYSGGYPGDIALIGTQALLLRGRSNGPKSFYAVTQGLVPGPNVVLDFQNLAPGGLIEPHQRWATGMLVDGGTFTGAGVRMGNRLTFGSGQGWSMGFGAVYNAKTGFHGVQQPPGSDNWFIGSTGNYSRKTAQPGPVGTVYSPGKPIWPASLYREQLRERRGEAAVGVLEPAL